MINRYDRIDPVRAQNALILVCACEKLPSSVREYEQRSLSVLSRARGSNRFKPIRIRITLNRFHVRYRPRGITPGGPLTARRSTHIVPISLLFGSSRRRAPSRFSCSFVGPHRTFRDEESLVSRVQKRQLAWEHTSRTTQSPEIR